jgi:hypothetical protein
MKTKILPFLAVLFFASISSNAQITQGKYLLGGSIGYYNSGSDNYSALNGNLQFGKVIKENTVMGIMGSISANQSHSENNPLTVNSYSAGIFYRTYKPLGKKFYLLQEVDLAFQLVNGVTYFSKIGASLATYSNGATITYIPGVSYSVSKRFQMELVMPNLASVSYAHLKTVDSKLPPNISSQKADNFSANVNLNANLVNNFGIGFKFLLGK